MVTLDDAKEVAAEIVKGFNPLLVTLFGSVARERFGNDLDLLVVFDDDQYHGVTTESQLQNSLGKYYRKFDIDPLTLPISRYITLLQSGEPFLCTITREGRVLYMVNHVNEWLRQSNEELLTAQYLLKGNFYRSACYHAKQSIEKVLKARLIEKGWDLEKTHSIRRLLAIAEEYNIQITFNNEDITFIDGIYRGRYPMDTGLLPQGEPNAEDAERAVRIALSLSVSGNEVNLND
jgi:HEPN domain-containing protein/predicted nucleotidyltransferase